MSVWLCVCVCVCVCVAVLMYMYMYNTCTCNYSVCVCVCYMYMYMYMYIVCVCVTCTCIYIVCVCMCVCVCWYTAHVVSLVYTCTWILCVSYIRDSIIQNKSIQSQLPELIMMFHWFVSLLDCSVPSQWPLRCHGLKWPQLQTMGY